MYRDVLLGSYKSPFQVSMLSSQVQRRRRSTTLVPGGGGDAALERSPSSLRASSDTGNPDGGIGWNQAFCV